MDKSDNKYTKTYFYLDLKLNLIIALLIILLIKSINVGQPTNDINFVGQAFIDEPVSTPIDNTFLDLKEISVDKDEPIDMIRKYVNDICMLYPNVEPELVRSIIYHESNFDPNAKNGNCLGLMQVSSYWHKERAKKLGVKDFFDPYSNVLLGVDYLSELIKQYKDTTLVLMLYNMKHDVAFKLYSEGKISGYAKSVLKKAEEYKEGG